MLPLSKTSALSTAVLVVFNGASLATKLRDVPAREWTHARNVSLLKATKWTIKHYNLKIDKVVIKVYSVWSDTGGHKSSEMIPFDRPYISSH